VRRLPSGQPGRGPSAIPMVCYGPSANPKHPQSFHCDILSGLQSSRCTRDPGRRLPAASLPLWIEQPPLFLTFGRHSSLMSMHSRTACNSPIGSSTPCTSWSRSAAPRARSSSCPGYVCTTPVELRWVPQTIFYSRVTAGKVSPTCKGRKRYNTRNVFNPITYRRSSGR